MSKVQNLFSLFILITLLQKIRSDWDYTSEQGNIESRPKVESNFGETQNESVIRTAITTDDEKFDDNELKKLFVRNFKLYENSGRERNKTEVSQTVKPRRRSRDVGNSSIFFGMDCFSCFGNGSSRADENCYKGSSIPSKKCSDAEHCFIELNPMFIKRGCILPGRLNRTFICKCPLCNDKPSFDTSHYDYKKINDWEYDNARLQTHIVGMDLMCKVCETKGTNPTSDKNCRFGKNADYMVCAHNQLCYTNIDDETDFVSRGCMDRPLYNSIYYFCNNSACNDEKFLNPKEKLRFRAEEIKFKEEPSIIKKKTVLKTNLSSKLSTIDLYLAMFLLFMKCI